ncbi:MAG: hypothetical protein ACLVAK_01940 [Clostridia bacterium]|jgi:hypothetical protein
MEIPKQIAFVVIVMLVGKACGYSEETIISLVKFIVGVEIIVNAEFIIKKSKDIKEYIIKLFAKN